jgi:hypothetical protein
MATFFYKSIFTFSLLYKKNANDINGQSNRRILCILIGRRCRQHYAMLPLFWHTMCFLRRGMVQPKSATVITVFEILRWGPLGSSRPKYLMTPNPPKYYSFTMYFAGMTGGLLHENVSYILVAFALD